MPMTDERGESFNSLSIPSDLLAEINAAADEDHRPAGEMLCGFIERGLEDRRWHRLLAFGAAQASKLGLSEADVPRLIAETRRE